MLPFALQRLGFDPASASAPFVATLVDVTGIVIYFSVAGPKPERNGTEVATSRHARAGEAGATGKLLSHPVDEPAREQHVHLPARQRRLAALLSDAHEGSLTSFQAAFRSANVHCLPGKPITLARHYRPGGQDGNCGTVEPNRRSTRAAAPTRYAISTPSRRSCRAGAGNPRGPLLIASGEGGPLDGALRLAEALARRDGMNAHVLGFARPLSSPSSYLLSRAADLERHELEACRRQAEHVRLRRQVHETVGLSSFFSTAVETGEFVSTAADTARVRKVEYVLVPLPGQGEPARAGAEDAALRLAEAADLPVLAVMAGADRLPRSALVNMDLGEASMRALPRDAPSGR